MGCALRQPSIAKPSNRVALQGVVELKDVPDGVLNAQQQRVKAHTLASTLFFDAAGATADLATHSLPAYFLDFETIQFTVPVWKGTRPYQQNAFQFSMHSLNSAGQLDQTDFLDLSDQDPAEPFARALIGACGTQGPVYVYNAGFETARIKELAARFPKLSIALLAINTRVVDLLAGQMDKALVALEQAAPKLKPKQCTGRMTDREASDLRLYAPCLENLIAHLAYRGQRLAAVRYARTLAAYSARSNGKRTGETLEAKQRLNRLILRKEPPPKLSCARLPVEQDGCGRIQYELLID